MRETLHMSEHDEVLGPREAPRGRFEDCLDFTSKPLLGWIYDDPNHMKQHVVAYEGEHTHDMCSIGGSRRSGKMRTYACKIETCSVKYVFTLRMVKDEFAKEEEHKKCKKWVLTRLNTHHGPICGQKKRKGDYNLAIHYAKEIIEEKPKTK